MNIVGENVVVSLGVKNVNFNVMITLNGSGAFLWEQLLTEKTEEELLSATLEEYEIDEVTAAKDIRRFITTLREVEILD